MLYKGKQVRIDDIFDNLDTNNIEAVPSFVEPGDPAKGYRFMYKATNGVLYPPLFGNHAWLEHSIQTNTDYEYKNYPFYEGQVNHVPEDANGQGGIFYFPRFEDSLPYFKRTLLNDPEAVYGPQQELFTFDMTSTYSKLQKWDRQYRSRAPGGQEFNPWTKKWFTVGPEGFSKEKREDGWETHMRITTIGTVNVAGSYNLYEIEGTSKGEHDMEIGSLMNDFYIPTEPIVSVTIAELYDYNRRKRPELFQK